MAVKNVPRIIVLNNKEQYLTTIDNSRKNSLHFVNDRLTIYLKNSAQMFEATFLKTNDDTQFLVSGNKLVMRYKNDDYVFTIVRSEEDEHIVQITALGVVLEASNAIRESYEGNNYLNIVDYIKMFDYEKMFTIYLNQLPEKKLRLNFSEETFLQRIFNLADLFDAEIKLYPILNEDYSIKHFALDIYKKGDNDQGIGSYHPEIRLRYGKDVSTIKRTVDIMELKTAIKPVGNNGLNLIGYQIDVKDENNKQLYYSTEQSGYIYAPQARDRFPSNRTGNNSDDFYIEYTKKYDTDSQAELAKWALADLKIDSEPKISYEIETVFRDLNIGDTIRIDDTGYTPRLMLEARLTKQEICFTNPINSKLTFSNFVELKSEIDPALIAKMKELAEQNKIYNAQILTDNTVVFKNNQGETTLIARVLDGIKDITDTLTITWLKGDTEVGNGKNLRVSAADVNGVQLYRFNAFKDGKLIGQAQISVADVVDGVDGQPGRDGKDGIAGKDGVGLKTTSVTYGLSDSETAQPATWSSQVPTLTKGKFLWTKTVWTYTDNTSETGYQKTYIARDGNNGTDGIAGKDGVGISSTTITYAASTSGTVQPISGWSATIPSVPSGQYLWTRTIWTYTDNTSEIGYSAAKMGETGPQGVPGADGTDGENAINAYLTNENITLKADTQGNLKSGQLALASGQMVVVDGPNVVTSGVSYSIVSQTGCTATIDSSGNYRLTALTADSASVILRASYKGTALQKTFSVNKLYDAAPGQNGTNGTNGKDGLNPITGYLTNESIIILANNNGSIDSQSLAQANGYFNIYNGQTKITNGVAYSIVSQTGVNVSLNTTTGYYNVNSMSADFGTAIFKAVYNEVEIQKQLMVVKSYKSLGLVASSTAPSNPNVGQLWLNTSNGVTYRWTGTEWSIYLLSATNLNVTNLSALSANMGTLRTGKMQSNDDLVSFDLDKKQLYMRLNNSPGDEYYGSWYNPGIKSQFWLTPSMFKYQRLEQSEQNGYYESGYDDNGFYVKDRSQGVSLKSYGLDFGNSIVLTPDYVSTDYEKDVTLPHGLVGNLRRVGKVVTLTIPRQEIDWQVNSGDYIDKSETIPFWFTPIDEVTVVINRFSGVMQTPVIMHILPTGKIKLTCSGKGYMAFTGTCSWVTN